MHFYLASCLWKGWTRKREKKPRFATSYVKTMLTMPPLILRISRIGSLYVPSQSKRGLMHVSRLAFQFKENMRLRIFKFRALFLIKV